MDREASDDWTQFRVMTNGPVGRRGDEE